jgi:hypothetical protein
MLDARMPLLVAWLACASGACVVYATSPPPATPAAARTLASNDFACPYDAVDVASIGGDQYVAFGCGRREVFNCVRDNDEDEVRCDRVAARNDAPQTVPVVYAPPPPVCYAACSASSSATCAASCNASAAQPESP